MFWYADNIEGTSSEMLETVLSNKFLDRETPVGSEDVPSSPTCTQPSLQNEQSKSIVTFATSVETCTGAKQESVKLTSSPMHDTKSVYSSSVSCYLFIHMSMQCANSFHITN